MYTQEPKRPLKLNLALWALSALLFAYGTQHLWLYLQEFGHAFIGKSQAALDGDLLLEIMEGVLLNAQFVCLFTVFIFLWVSVLGKVSTLGVFLSLCAAQATNANLEHIYYFAEYILPNLFIAAVVLTPLLMTIGILPRNPSRVLALLAAMAVVTIVTMFHVVLISGLQNHLKEQSRQAVARAAQVAPESLSTYCQSANLQCAFVEPGQEYVNGDEPLERKIRDILSKTQAIQKPVVTGFDVTQKHLSALPAAKDEVFAAVAPAGEGRIVAIDLAGYPTLRKKLAFYVTLMSIAAITIWQVLSISLMFFHQRKKRRGGFD